MSRYLIRRLGPAPAGVRLALVCLVLAPASLAAQRGRLLVPLPQLEARAHADSNDPAAQYELGLAYLLERRPDDAERAFGDALKVDSKFAPAYFGLSVLPFSRRPSLWKDVGRDKIPDEWLPALEEAWAWRRRAVMLDPMVDLKVLVAVAPPREAMGANKWEVMVYTELSKGFEYFWDGQYERAFDWFDEIVKYDEWLKSGKPLPDWLLWYHGLAAAHSLNHNVAIADFRELLDRAIKEEEDPDRVHMMISEANDFRYVLAVLNQQAGRLQDATALYREALTIDLGLYAAHSRLADILEGRKNWREAVKERQRALESNPEDPGLLFDLGLTYARMGAWAPAADPLRRAMELSPRTPRIPYVLGDVYARLGENAEARATWERFIAVAPSSYSTEIATARRKLEALP